MREVKKEQEQQQEPSEGVYSPPSLVRRSSRVISSGVGGGACIAGNGLFPPRKGAGAFRSPLDSPPSAEDAAERELIGRETSTSGRSAGKSAGDG